MCPQLEALYNLLDDDKNGQLSVHEMIDLFVRLTATPDGPLCLIVRACRTGLTICDIVIGWHQQRRLAHQRL